MFTKYFNSLKSEGDEGKRKTLPTESKSSDQADSANPNEEEPYRNINVERPKDKSVAHVSGVLTIAEKIVVVDYNNYLLKLFNDRGVYLSSTALRDDARGVTRVSDDTFATCNWGNEVYLWNITGQTVTCSDVTYHVDSNAWGIMYDGTYFCMLYRNEDAVTILDRHGRHVRKITPKEAFGKKILFGFDIFMDGHSHDIYVPCLGDNGGVFCMSVVGEPLWFTPLPSDLFGISEIRGFLCVADRSGRCLHLLSKAGKYERKLMEENDLDGIPQNIFYDDKRGKLYVSFPPFTDKYNVISVYSVTF